MNLKIGEKTKTYNEYTKRLSIKESIGPFKEQIKIGIKAVSEMIKNEEIIT